MSAIHEWQHDGRTYQIGRGASGEFEIREKWNGHWVPRTGTEYERPTIKACLSLLGTLLETQPQTVSVLNRRTGEYEDCSLTEVNK